MVGSAITPWGTDGTEIIVTVFLVGYVCVVYWG